MGEVQGKGKGKGKGNEGGKLLLFIPKNHQNQPTKPPTPHTFNILSNFKHF